MNAVLKNYKSDWDFCNPVESRKRAISFTEIVQEELKKVFIIFLNTMFILNSMVGLV